MYIVTGGAGFIGSAVVWGLNQKGIDDILIVDHLGTSEKWKNLRALKYTDYMEKDMFRDLMLDFESCKIDAIIHMGACSATTEQDASYLLDNNYKYSVELAEFAVDHNIPFIYASSAATYGNGEMGYDDNEKELEKLRPMNMYGYSKQMFDLWAKRNNLLDKITGLKFTNIFGPNEAHKDDMRSVVHKAYGQILNSGKVKLFKSYRKDYADGEQMRDFHYVKDAVDMLIFLLENRKTGIYNIGSGKAKTWNSLINAVFSAMDLKANIEYINMPEHLRDKYQYFTEAKMEKIKKEGYDKPNTALDDGIKDYVKNYLMKEKFLGDE